MCKRLTQGLEKMLRWARGNQWDVLSEMAMVVKVWIGTGERCRHNVE